ncbi:acid protease [Dendrothele bispora CBS 962.96]|uniref:Acid protease n=1 Tax=Dendrothele bispora (strain CBS 962.96) TaxID=1314807 RepID=A0A4S8MR25_DENBC|nr:acid protease [Dendrothele bispora CBS 962.96]
MRVPARSFFLSTFLLSYATAVQLDLVGLKREPGLRSLYRRDDSGVFGNGSLALQNFGDLLYSCNVTLGGKDFPVIIDTGSVDLWVLGDVPETNNLSLPLTLPFGKGAAEGFINTVQMEFNGFTIPDQAYMNAIAVQDIAFTGIIGLGPSSASPIRAMLNDSSGDPALDRIFRQNMSTPNTLTFLLSRNATLEGPLVDQFFSQLTIGTVVPGFEAIQDSPKLPALLDQFGPSTQHWTTLLDPNGIIGPDGQQISTTTSIPNPTDGTPDQLHVVLDSGFSVPQLPAYVADAIYGRIPGAEFIEDGSTLHPELAGFVNFWRIPCEYEVNVSFVFAGQEYPVSPLDLNADTQLPDINAKRICIAFFQQIADNIAGNPEFGALDMILGMGFLRNTYSLFNFGDFVDGSPDNVADPYIQLLSTVDKAKMHREFVVARLGGKDTTGSQPALLPSIQKPAVTPQTSGGSATSGNSGLDTGVGSVAASFNAVCRTSRRGSVNRRLKC